MPRITPEQKANMVLYIITACSVLAMVLIMSSMQSCGFVKDVQKTNTDSNVVNKTTQGQVTTGNTSQSQTDEWWRETIRMFMGKRDTNVNVINVPPGEPVDIPAPIAQPYAIIVREGGKTTNQFNAAYYDSLWKARQDSTSISKQEKTKQSETEFFSPGTILALFGGLALLVIGSIVAVLFFLNKKIDTILPLIKNRTP